MMTGFLSMLNNNAVVDSLNLEWIRWIKDIPAQYQN